jgi:hypothetical protein
MKIQEKEIYISLEDPTAKGKIFSFETFKFYNKLQYTRRLKMKKIIQRINDF